MKSAAKDLWQRALTSFKTAQNILELDPDSAASRAYYAAFYAVSAQFVLTDQIFSKHSAVEAAVHRDLVKTQQWPPALGADYSFLRGLRETGDYGGSYHVSLEDIKLAIKGAKRILRQVHISNPDLFNLDSSL